MNLRYTNKRPDKIGQLDTMSLYWLLSGVGTILGAYHGYKRNNSIGWGIAWGLLGGAFPFITIPVAFAQGFAKRA